MSSGSGNISNVVTFGGGAITSTVANGTCPQITVPLSNLSSMVTLLGGNASTTSGDFYGLYSASSPTTQTQYEVPSGKAFYCLGMYLTCPSGDILQLGYGTGALGSEGTASAPSGAIYYSPTSTVTTSPFISTVAGPAYSYYPVGFAFPAGSYPFWRPSASTVEFGIILIGIVQ